MSDNKRLEAKIDLERLEREWRERVESKYSSRGEDGIRPLSRSGYQFQVFFAFALGLMMLALAGSMTGAGAVGSMVFVAGAFIFFGLMAYHLTITSSRLKHMEKEEETYKAQREALQKIIDENSSSSSEDGNTSL